MSFAEMFYLVVMMAFSSYAVVLILEFRHSFMRTLDLITYLNLNWFAYAIPMLWQPFYLLLKHDTVYATSLYAAAVGLFVLGKTGGHQLAKKRNNIQRQERYIIESLFVSGIILLNLCYTYHISIINEINILFAILAIVLTHRLYIVRTQQVSYIHGIFILGGVLIYLANNMFRPFWVQDMYIMIQMGVLFLTLTGVFFYFYEYYSQEVTKQREELKELSYDLSEARLAMEELAYCHPVTKFPNQAMLIKDWSFGKEGMNYKTLGIIEITNWHQVEHQFDSWNRDGMLKRIVEEIQIQDCFEQIYHIRDNEFAVMTGLHTETMYELMSDCLNKCLNNVIQSRWQCSLEIHAGLGSLSEGRDINQALHEANLARQIAIRQREHVAVYSPRFKATIDAEMIFESKLRRAVKEAPWHIYYQPKIKVADETVCGAEALIRWPDMDGKFGSPGYFIPKAEQFGIINEIGDYVIDEVFQYARRFDGICGPEFEFSINLSPMQLSDEVFLERLAWKIREYDIDPKMFIFELTESSEIKDFTYVVDKLCKLKSMGFKVSLDDFGVGYSNLHSIPQLPIDEIKFDKLIAERLATKHEYRIVMEYFLLLAQKLNLRTVVEGIEKLEQSEIIKEMGVDQCQGYYFSRPLDSETFYRYLNDKRKAS